MTPETSRRRNAFNASWGRKKRASRLPAAISAGSLALVALLIACEQQLLPTASSSDEPVATILTLNVGDRVVIGLGNTVKFYVTPRDSLGTPVDDYIITWTSSDSSIVIVDDVGSATGLTLGTTALTVSAEKPGSRGKGKEGAPGQLKKQIDVIVDPEPVASVEVIPDQAVVSVGQTLKLTAVARDANGNVLEDRVVGWSSSNIAVAPVDEQGNVTGSAPGSARVTATSEGVGGDAAISVPSPSSPVVDLALWPSDVNLDPGQRVQFYAAFLHADSTVTCVPESPSTDPTVLYNATVVAGCDSATVRLDLSKAHGTSSSTQTRWTAADVLDLMASGDD